MKNVALIVICLVCIMFNQYLPVLFTLGLITAVISSCVLQQQRRNLRELPLWWQFKFPDRYRNLINYIRNLEWALWSANAMCTVVAAAWAVRLLWHFISK